MSPLKAISLFTFGLSLCVSNVGLAQTVSAQRPPDRLVGYWNTAENRRKEWEELDRQLTQMLSGSKLCENYAEVHAKMDDVQTASNARISALQAYYRANRDLHQQLVTAAKGEIAGSAARARHILELWDLENKYLEELGKRRAELAKGIETAGNTPSAAKGKEALSTLDELIAGAQQRQKIREATRIDITDNRHINQELQQQAALLFELATKHSDTVDLENEMWQTYYKARSSRLILTCKPNQGMHDPTVVFPHKKDVPGK